MVRFKIDVVALNVMVCPVLIVTFELPDGLTAAACNVHVPKTFFSQTVPPALARSPEAADRHSLIV